eukprot:Selendium_serpulae@DN5385_c0_g1_i2.p1
MPWSGNRQNDVAYFYHDHVGNYHYGTGHPMKPHRIRMTDELMSCYGLQGFMDRMIPRPIVDEVFTRFHADDYIDFLKNVTIENQLDHADAMQRFNVGEDCPVFDGLWEFCSIYTSGSIGGSQALMEGGYDVAINWAGGLHHGKQSEASGFCYVNDCVLAVLDLLRYKHRVLYVDVDIHHGDGVEEAFYTSPRLMSVSFHKYGDFFPGTGALKDIGINCGRGYSVNVPLHDGCSNETFMVTFKRVMDLVMSYYRPEAIVLQSGADSLSGDRLGCFNLTLEGHGYAAKYLRQTGVPMVVVGGGGYTLRNVPKCWTYESASLLGLCLNPYIPASSQYMAYYAPDCMLGIRKSNMPDHNNSQYLDAIIQAITENFRDHVYPVCTNASAESKPGLLPNLYRSERDEDVDCDVNTDRPTDDEVVERRTGSLATPELMTLRRAND